MDLMLGLRISFINIINSIMNKDDDENQLLNSSQSLQPMNVNKSTILLDSILSPMKPDGVPKDDGHLQQNKRTILVQFTILFLVILFLIVERVIYQIFVNEENKIMAYLQKSLGLAQLQDTSLGEMYFFQSNFIFQIAGNLHRSGINLMLFTNIFLTLYVGFDALIAAKIMYTSYLAVFIISYLQLLYGNPRPFWIQTELVTSVCLPSYANPSSFICQLCYTAFYIIHCYRIKNHVRSFKKYDKSFEKKVVIAQLTIAAFVVLYSLILFLMALQYILNALLGALYALIFYACCVNFENQISNIMKHTTIMNIDSKRYVFYISIILLACECAAFISFQHDNEVLDISWIINYMNCLYTTEEGQKAVPAQLLIGSKFTFEKTTVVFALIGSFFGVAHCFRQIKTLEWYKGPLRNRILRVLIANLSTIPGWLFVSFVGPFSLIPKVYEWGLSQFLMSSVFFLCYYFALFAWLPLQVFGRLGLNARSSTSYVVVNME